MPKTGILNRVGEKHNKMKSILVTVAFIFGVCFCSKSQSIGDLHNEALDSVLAKFGNRPVNFDSLYTYAGQYANVRSMIIPSYSNLRTTAATYIVGKSGTEMLSLAITNSLVSTELGTYMNDVVNDLSQITDATQDSVSAHLDVWLQSSDYNNLSTSDKTIASNFNDVFNKSYIFWDNLAVSRKCGIKCAICIVLVDAFWTAVTGNPVAGALFSAISRCCGCGSCGSKVSCFES
jgi:hypothetical protein